MFNPVEAGSFQEDQSENISAKLFQVVGRCSRHVSITFAEVGACVDPSPNQVTSMQIGSFPHWVGFHDNLQV